MKMPGAIAICAAVGLFLGAHDASRRSDPADGNSFVQRNGADVDRRLVLPPTLDRGLRTEIESAPDSMALEAVLLRHPEQGQLLVPRIEALAVEEIRRDGPRDRFVIPGLEPDDGEGNSITLQAVADRMTLVTEFPGDIARVRFSDGSVHRFVGRFPFADVVTLIGEGDKNHRLTFAVLEDQMVYLRGAGHAVSAREGTIEFGGPK